MSYTNNPQMPQVRMKAVLLVRKGWSVRRVARYTGFSHGAIINWLKKAPSDGRLTIPTLSSRPRHHPRELRMEIVSAIVEQRKKRNRCSEVVYQELLNQGIKTSLSSVKRTLKRHNLLRNRSPWKRWHFAEPRPIPNKPGDLVQIDTVHFMLNDKRRIYVYTLLDVASRWAFAFAVSRINTHNSLSFIKKAQKKAGFKFHTIQSDHGSEFSSWFTEQVNVLGIRHRHIRVRKAIDNSYIERFNRTLQDECLSRIKKDVKVYQKAIAEYLPYYNNERLHLGIFFKTPLQVVTSY